MKPATSSFRRRQRAKSLPKKRRLFAEQWTNFQEALESPPWELPTLEELLTKPGYFDSNQEPSGHQGEED